MKTEPLVKFLGLVCAGRGVAAHAINNHTDKIESILGSEPYPGTLNVVFSEPLTLKNGIQLDEKSKHVAVYGTINDTPCLIERFSGAPLHVVEIISSAFLRDTLGLKDGQIVELSVPKGTFVAPSRLRSWLWSLFYKDKPSGYYDATVLKQILRWKLFHKLVCQKRFY